MLSEPVTALMTEIPKFSLSKLRLRIGLPTDCGSIVVVEADMQAGSVIGYNAIHGECDMIASTDSDFGALCGQSCLLFDCDFPAARKKKQDVLSKIIVSSPQRSTIVKAMVVTTIIHRKQSQDANSPIFEDYTWMRALDVVAVGCDQCVKGVPGIGLGAIRTSVPISSPDA